MCRKSNLVGSEHEKDRYLLRFDGRKLRDDKIYLRLWSGEIIKNRITMTNLYWDILIKLKLKETLVAHHNKNK